MSIMYNEKIRGRKKAKYVLDRMKIKKETN
jgi:hypothetical protein